MVALAPGEGRPDLLPGADALVRGPALGAPGQRDPRRVVPVGGDVVPDLVRDDRLDGRAVRQVLSGRDDQALTREVAALGAGAAQPADLLQRREVEPRERELPAVVERCDEIGHLLPGCGVDRIVVRELDVDRLARL